MGKYFLPPWGLPFTLSKVSSDAQKGFVFQKCSCVLFSAVWCPGKSNVTKLSPVFSSQDFIVLSLTFKSLIYSGLSFVHDAWHGPHFSPLHGETQRPGTPCGKGHPSPVGWDRHSRDGTGTPGDGTGTPGMGPAPLGWDRHPRDGTGTPGMGSAPPGWDRHPRQTHSDHEVRICFWALYSIPPASVWVFRYHLDYCSFAESSEISVRHPSFVLLFREFCCPFRVHGGSMGIVEESFLFLEGKDQHFSQ